MDELCACEKPALTLRELEAQITELAGHLNAAHYRWLCLIAEFDRRHGWSDGATQSCAHWLNIWTPPVLQERIRLRIQEGLHKYIRPCASVDAVALMTVARRNLDIGAVSDTG
jgi:hypothetical protein